VVVLVVALLEAIVLEHLLFLIKVPQVVIITEVVVVAVVQVIMVQTALAVMVVMVEKFL
jgi:hypothetical protein